jgi:hypothetical protein
MKGRLLRTAPAFHAIEKLLAGFGAVFFMLAAIFFAAVFLVTAFAFTAFTLAAFAFFCFTGGSAVFFGAAGQLYAVGGSAGSAGQSISYGCAGAKISVAYRRRGYLQGSQSHDSARNEGAGKQYLFVDSVVVFHLLSVFLILNGMYVIEIDAMRNFIFMP